MYCDIVKFHDTVDTTIRLLALVFAKLIYWLIQTDIYIAFNCYNWKFCYGFKKLISIKQAELYLSRKL